MDAMPRITVFVSETVYQAHLYDNDAARELVWRMPLKLDMEELNGNEKFYYLPEPLPADTETVGNIHTGDIMLYGSDCLVLFFEDFQTPFHYTRIGCLEESAGLSNALAVEVPKCLSTRQNDISNREHIRHKEIVTMCQVRTDYGRQSEKKKK